MTKGLWSGLALSTLSLLGSTGAAYSLADLLIASNPVIIMDACMKEFKHSYRFTVVDDGGGMSTPTISNLDYPFTGPNLIDIHDDLTTDPFTYGAFEIDVTIPAPLRGTQVKKCFTITYEGEAINPCFDIARPKLPRGVSCR
jgi:hypothetical protein